MVGCKLSFAEPLNSRVVLAVAAYNYTDLRDRSSWPKGKEREDARRAGPVAADARRAQPSRQTQQSAAAAAAAARVASAGFSI